MSLTVGTRLGPYEITAMLGAGGMGEVYRARDARLQRDVAIKILPDALAHDPDRLARFEREAQVLASLSHPNIAAIYGLEEQSDVASGFPGPSSVEGSRTIRALVLELVEGDTLEDRIARGPLPVDEALAVARQIADALEAAHEAGVVHRDLKPANVKITPAGHVKVLDFGLAKMREPAVSTPGGTQAPTITSPAMMTGVGMILGTAAYMSPEQARGKVVDRRADIWAFGCVLYELLTARRAFADEDVSLTLSKVLQREPDFDALPANTPAAVRQTLRLCLKKDPKQRLQAIGDVRLALEGGLESHPTPIAATTAAPRRRWRRAVELAAVAVLAGLGTGVAAWLLTRPAPPPATRLTAVHPGPEPLTIGGSQSIVISPDGQRILYQGATGSRRQIYVRELDQLTVAPLGSIENPYSVFLSPDGQWVGFIDALAGGSLKKIAITGGPVVIICRLPPTLGASGASWGADGTIVFGSGNPGGGLWRVNAAGGTPEALTTPDPQKGDGRHGSPEILPGGQAVLFANVPGSNRSEDARIEVLNLTTGERTTLVQGGNHPRYVASGHLVYEVEGTLRAVAFDLDRLAVVGNPVPVAEGLAASPWESAFSVAPNGTLVYLQGTATVGATRTLVWVDRQGREEALKLPPRAYAAVSQSPDGTRLALEVRDENLDIWVWHLIRQTLTRLTFDPEANFGAVWSPDGQRLAFSRGADGENIYWQAADGTGTPERLTQRPKPQRPSAFAPDASALLFHEPPAGQDIGIVTLSGDRKSELILQTPFDEANPEVSSDGRWLAYQSNESGRPEIYVRPFPKIDAGRWQVSTDGGTRPLWARNSRELFYYVQPGTIMAVPIETGSGFAAGTPRLIFTGDYLAPVAHRPYDVSPDGQRFLMIKAAPGEAAAPPQLVVVQNWLEELKRLVPVD